MTTFVAYAKRQHDPSQRRPHRIPCARQELSARRRSPIARRDTAAARTGSRLNATEPAGAPALPAARIRGCHGTGDLAPRR
jgi:hypothetical protein